MPARRRALSSAPQTQLMTEPTTRRGFLAFVTLLLGSIPFVGGLIVALRAGLAPARSDRPARLPLCRLDEVPPDDILVRVVSFQMRRGPAVEDVARVVFVTRDPAEPGRILALSGECTHLTCPVQKREVEKAAPGDEAPLRCPCHGGRFSRTGEVLGGPPPRPLRRLAHEPPADGRGMIWLIEV